MTDPYARIDAVLAEATPGPWKHYTEDRWNGGDICRADSPFDCATTSGPDGDVTEADARFIVRARNILPAALDVVKAAAYLRSVENDPESSLAVKPARLLLDERLAAFHRIEEEQT